MSMSETADILALATTKYNMKNNIRDLIEGIQKMRYLLNKGEPITYEQYYNLLEWKYVSFQFGNFPKLNIFRATIIGQNEDEDKLDQYRFSYPDPKKGVKVNIGRANIKDYPMFYGSTDFMGSILEIIKTESDSKIKSIPSTIFVSEWTIKKPTKFIVHDIRNILSKVPYDKVSPEETVYLNFYLKYFSDIFSSPNAYDFSSRYAHNLLVGIDDKKGGYSNILEEPIEMLIYPSIITKSQTVNYAITPTAINEKFSLKSISKMQLPKNLNKDNLGNGIHMKKLKIGRLNSKKEDALIEWFDLDS